MWQFHSAFMSTINIFTVAAKTSDKSIGINTLTTTTVTTETDKNSKLGQKKGDQTSGDCHQRSHLPMMHLFGPITFS